MLSLDNQGIPLTQAHKLVRCYFDAWNEFDASAVASFFTRNGIYFDIPINEQHSGPELLSYLSDFFGGEEKARYDLVGEVLVGADAVAFKYQAFDLDSTARRPEPWAGVEFWKLDGGKVARVDDYYEPANLRRSIEATTQHPPKYLKSGLNATTTSHYRARLLQLVDDEQLYRQPDLSLPELARQVPCSVNHLSQVINAEFGMSFFEFLNRRRVADAKQLLTRDPDCYVLDVALQVGFNSSSAFYSAFKKAYELTPTAFRRQAIQPDLTDATPIGAEGSDADVG
jgi:AraC-like DNA-binding protein